MDVPEILKKLRLEPLADEGGYFSETYRSALAISGEAVGRSVEGERSLATAIYYLLTPGQFSALHRLASDEIYHFYLGDPVEMLLLYPDASSTTLVLGSNILEGMVLQAVVPAGIWQGSRLAPGGKYALMGTTMAPGFDPSDFEMGMGEELAAHYPEVRDLILSLAG